MPMFPLKHPLPKPALKAARRAKMQRGASLANAGAAAKPVMAQDDAGKWKFQRNAVTALYWDFLPASRKAAEE